MTNYTSFKQLSASNNKFDLKLQKYVSKYLFTNNIVQQYSTYCKWFNSLNHYDLQRVKFYETSSEPIGQRPHLILGFIGASLCSPMQNCCWLDYTPCFNLRITTVKPFISHKLNQQYCANPYSTSLHILSYTVVLLILLLLLLFLLSSRAANAIICSYCEVVRSKCQQESRGNPALTNSRELFNGPNKLMEETNKDTWLLFQDILRDPCINENCKGQTVNFICGSVDRKLFRLYMVCATVATDMYCAICMSYSTVSVVYTRFTYCLKL